MKNRWKQLKEKIIAQWNKTRYSRANNLFKDHKCLRISLEDLTHFDWLSICGECWNIKQSNEAISSPQEAFDKLDLYQGKNLFVCLKWFLDSWQTWRPFNLKKFEDSAEKFLKVIQSVKLKFSFIQLKSILWFHHPTSSKTREELLFTFNALCNHMCKIGKEATEVADWCCYLILSVCSKW